MRAFIALSLDETAREFAARQQALLQYRWRETGVNTEQLKLAVRAVPPSQFHLTLLFLGEIEVAQIPQVQDQLRNAAQGVHRSSVQSTCRENTVAASTLHLQFAPFGCFPNAKNPRVIWLGIGGEVARLMALQKEIARRILPLCPRADGKIFHPHLTLFRIQTRRRDLAQCLAVPLETETHFSDIWPVQKIQLMHSELTPLGAKYRELACLEL